MLHVYRFDYKHRGLPYYIYISFKTIPSHRTLQWIVRCLRSYNYEYCKPLELQSINEQGISVMTYRTFKDLAKGICRQRPSLPYPMHFGNSDLPF